MPSVPLAACFAFGAALGPTDAVAVSSLSGRVNIPKKAMHNRIGPVLFLRTQKEQIPKKFS
ncbi:hypothetical protein EfmAA242_12220 [Enterococcus faecium]|nr:hypothetical protein EfmAA242_12220 [Enterococcus faecium]